MERKSLANCGRKVVLLEAILPCPGGTPGNSWRLQIFCPHWGMGRCYWHLLGRPGVLFNISEHTGQPPLERMICSQKSAVPRWEQKLTRAGWPFWASGRQGSTQRGQ